MYPPLLHKICCGSVKYKDGGAIDYSQIKNVGEKLASGEMFSKYGLELAGTYLTSLDAIQHAEKIKELNPVVILSEGDYYVFTKHKEKDVPAGFKKLIFDENDKIKFANGGAIRRIKEDDIIEGSVFGLPNGKKCFILNRFWVVGNKRMDINGEEVENLDDDSRRLLEMWVDYKREDDGNEKKESSLKSLKNFLNNFKAVKLGASSKQVEFNEQTLGKEYWVKEEKESKFANGGKVLSKEERYNIVKGIVNDAFKKREGRKGDFLLEKLELPASFGIAYLESEGIKSRLLPDKHGYYADLLIPNKKIASAVGLPNGWQIQAIRDTAIQMLMRDGDIFYSEENLKKLLQEAKDEWLENHHESKFESGGNIEAQLEKYAKKDVAVLEKDGAMAITDTKHGVIHGQFENGVFKFYNRLGEEVFSGGKQKAVEFVKNSYTVEQN